MTLENDKHAKMRALARQCAYEITRSNYFRDMLREIVLNVLCTQEDMRRMGAVDAFLWECEARDIKVTLEADGKLYFTNREKLGQDLRAVLVLHREDIIARLQYQRKLEAQAAARLQGPHMRAKA